MINFVSYSSLFSQRRVESYHHCFCFYEKVLSRYLKFCRLLVTARIFIEIYYKVKVSSMFCECFSKLLVTQSAKFNIHKCFVLATKSRSKRMIRECGIDFIPSASRPSKAADDFPFRSALDTGKSRYQHRIITSRYIPLTSVVAYMDGFFCLFSRLSLLSTRTTFVRCTVPSFFSILYTPCADVIVSRCGL